MSYREVFPGTTVCDDTPQNRAEFNQLKRALVSGNRKPASLGQQISKENKRLRSLRAFLPGYEPDR